MATIKSYTDLEQSKKLAEILPIESADMCYIAHSELINIHEPFYKKADKEDTPCWSLAALLEILDYPQLSKNKLGSGKAGWMVSVYQNDCRYNSCWNDNPIDACYEMIILLKRLKML